MKTKIISVLILMMAGTQLYAGSIWAKRNTELRHPYTDEVARKVGDILTITIAETAKIENKVENKLSNINSRGMTVDATLGTGTTTKNGTTHSNVLPTFTGLDLGATSSRTMDGSADFKDNRKFVDEIAVVVEDVMPNGNLVVVGSRFREVAGDIQEIRVSGIIRPTDISFTNTINSQKVANFQMVFTNKGPSDTYNKRGWMSWLEDIIWPM